MTQPVISTTPYEVSDLRRLRGPGKPTYCTSMCYGVRCNGGPPDHYFHGTNTHDGYRIWTDEEAGVHLNEMPAAIYNTRGNNK